MKSFNPQGTDWSRQEIDLIVADYFEMLFFELSNQSYVKSQRNANLQKMIGRSRGSIEFKHQNISAALLYLGLPWIHGYKPMANLQGALIDGIERYLDSNSVHIEKSVNNSKTPGLSEREPIFLEPPPDSGLADTVVPDAMRRLVRKFDPAERDARNRRLGRSGEQLVFWSEQSNLRSAGRTDLARKIRWVSEEDGDGAGYDILSFTLSGDERLIEVKTTVGDRTTPFYITENEKSLSEERQDAFRLVRLYDFARTPRAFELAPPLSNHVFLNPTNYIARFR